MSKQIVVSDSAVINKIYLIRNKKVMLDYDLAALYKVATKSLNLAVKRNTKRFPEDFMFQLTKAEWEGLRFQIETSKKRGGTRYLPYESLSGGIKSENLDVPKWNIQMKY